MNLLKIIYLLILSISLSSCTSISFAPSKVGQNYAIRKKADQIEVFKSQTPNKKFFEIGSVTACCSSDTEKLVNKLRKEASENGGDALIGIEPFAGQGISAAVIRYEN